MTAGRMPGLAQLIELHKEKSHILRSVLDLNLKHVPANDVGEKECVDLQEAVGHLKADQLRKHSIPDAIAELREVGTLTESTVDTIMSKAETLMEQDEALDDAMAILEACSFQDIVGQRLSKVTELLEILEERMHCLAHETGIADNAAALCDKELEIEMRRKELILHGPQLTGNGVTQDEIDALLGA